MSEHTYTTPTGITVKLVALPQLQVDLIRTNAIKEWQRENGALPDKPTYTISTDDGAEETHEHDETTIADDPAAKRAWAEWMRKRSECEAYASSQVMDFFMLRGIRVEIPADGWEKQQQRFGIIIPEDEIERRLHYIRTEVFSGPADIGDVMTKIMELSGTPQEVVDAARTSFRDSVRQPDRADAG